MMASTSFMGFSVVGIPSTAVTDCTTSGAVVQDAATTVRESALERRRSRNSKELKEGSNEGSFSKGSLTANGAPITNGAPKANGSPAANGAIEEAAATTYCPF